MLVPLSYLSFVRSSSIIYSRQNKEESEVNRGWKSQEVKELRINTGLTTIWFPLTNYESRTIYFYMIHLHCFSTEDKQWGPALCILTLNTTNRYFHCADTSDVYISFIKDWMPIQRKMGFDTTLSKKLKLLSLYLITKNGTGDFKTIYLDICY